MLKKSNSELQKKKKVMLCFDTVDDNSCTTSLKRLETNLIILVYGQYVFGKILSYNFEKYR